MAVKITFYPLGNADTSLIELTNDQFVLMDFADMRDYSDRDDKRCKLQDLLREKLRKAGKDSFDVVCFSHLDRDHINGTTDFFELRYKKETQGEGRPKIDELWVPAAAITEVGSQIKKDAWAIRQEARHRLIKGKGIKVFSRPDDLKGFLEENGLSPKDREDCIIDAGRTIPGFSLEGAAKAEFFLHCPFAWRTDDRDGVDRNQDSVVFQATFNEDGTHTRVLFGSDVDSGTLSQIVRTTKSHNNEDKLSWDVLKLFHHCSYTALNSAERGKDETSPVEDVEWLIEDQGTEKCRIVSPSSPIPAKGSDEDNEQPPHRQAAAYYKRILRDKNGEFKVTMESPTVSSPKPLVLDISRYGHQFATAVASAMGSSVERTTRQGHTRA